MLLVIKLKITTLYLFSHKNIAVYIFLIFLTIFIAVILMHLNRALILIMIFIMNLKDRFLTTVCHFF